MQDIIDESASAVMGALSDKLHEMVKPFKSQGENKTGILQIAYSYMNGY